MSSDGSDSEEHRNPSPPRELLEASDDIKNADKIGDTVFSKQWVYQTLMKLIQDVEKHQSVEKTNADDSNAGYDVDDGLQNELCELWDMSTNQDVAKFLQDYKVVDILSAIITRSKAPRATEICVGILGNLACKEDICRDMSEKEGFIDLILYLLENPDTPTLVETTRLVFACISSSAEISKMWIDAIVKIDIVYKSLVFIVSSSTSDVLLRNTGELLDRLLDVSDEICNTWSTEEMVAALLETLTQIKTDSDSDGLLTYLHIFQLISTCENGVQALALHLEPVYRALCSYLKHICSEDEILGLGGREGSLAAVISVVNVLITVPDKGYQLVIHDQDFTRCLLKILEALYPRMRTERQSSRDSQRQISDEDRNHGDECRSNRGHDVRGHHGNDADVGEVNVSKKETFPEQTKIEPNSTNENPNLHQVTAEGDNAGRGSTDHVTSGLLFGIIRSILIDIIEMLSAHQDTTHTNEPPPILSYLSNYCPRSRLRALLLCLNFPHGESESESDSDAETSDCQTLTRQLFDVVKSHELNRIADMIKDFVEKSGQKKSRSCSPRQDTGT